MSVVVKSFIECDVCGEHVADAFGATLLNVSAPMLPHIVTHQWRSLGVVIDLCDGCAVTVKAAVTELLKASAA